MWYHWFLLLACSFFVCHWNRLFLLTDLIKLSSLTSYFIHGLFSVWCFPVAKRFLLGYLGGMINWFINITEMKKLIIRKFQFCHLMPWSYQLMFVKIVMLNFWYIDKYWFKNPKQMSCLCWFSIWLLCWLINNDFS